MYLDENLDLEDRVLLNAESSCTLALISVLVFLRILLGDDRFYYSCSEGISNNINFNTQDSDETFRFRQSRRTKELTTGQYA
jgi:hypothetical protein